MMKIGSELLILEHKDGSEEIMGSIPLHYFYGYIYGIINIRTGKIMYVGQSRYNKNDPYNRPNKYMGSGIIIKRFIKKHGNKDLFKFIIEQGDNQDELDKLERYYIKLYNTKAPRGWNISKGGQGLVNYKHKKHKSWHHTDETKKKISIASKMMWQNEEIANKIREKAKRPNSGQFKKGNIPWVKGLTKEICPKIAHTKETRERISIKMKEYRKRIRDEIYKNK